MGLDIRLPLGLIFLITGFIMLVYGVATSGSAMYEISMGMNINIIWGGVMVLFGAIMVYLGKKKTVS